MGIAEGSIKQYAEQGLITAEVVKNAMFASADEINAKFESMPMTWAQIATKMQNTALAAFDPVLTRLNQVANSAQFNTVINGAINGLAMLATVATGVLDLLINGAAFVVDNWSWISPIVYGLVAAFIAYNAVALITNGINAAKALTNTNIYTEILAASQALDDAEVPETGRVLVVTPAIYVLMKQCKDIIMETNVGNELRLQGVIGILDGMNVQKIPAARLPEDFGFMVAHPCATVAPVKLEDYTVHENPPGISGSLVEGRICYGAFVLDNKKSAIYYQAQPASE